MEKVELKRKEIINLLNSMTSYVKVVGKNGDKLAHLCNSVSTYDPNEAFVEDHNKRANKLTKEFQRNSQKAINNNAMMYEAGDKKGTFVLDEKGELTFNAAGKNKANEEIDALSDTYEEKVSELMNEKAFFYVEKVEQAPENLSVEYRDSLSLLI